MNDKPIILIMTFLSLFLFLSGTAVAANEIEIRTVEELKAVYTTENLSKNYILTADLKIDDGTWLSVGNYDEPFTGSFDGNQKTITFTRDTVFTKKDSVHPEYDGYGLFGNVGEPGELKNIKIIAEGNLTNNGSQNFGGLLGISLDSAVISGCSVDIKPGFLIISNNQNYESDSFVGGLAGWLSSGRITESHVTGSVAGINDVGGLAGKFSYGEISNSSFIGSVEGKDFVGGLVGFSSNGNFSGSYVLGSVDGNNGVGGLLGFSYQSQASESFFEGTAKGNNGVGGLVGNS